MKSNRSTMDNTDKVRQNRIPPEAHPGNGEAYSPEGLKTEQGSPLAGKRLLFLGSSVTYGSASLRTSMADYMGILDGCEIVKEAVSGTTLSDIEAGSYVARLKKVSPEQPFDGMICQLSTNDATRGLPLGTVSASREYDTATVVGAMEWIISYVKTTWNCPVFFYTGTRYESDAYQAMVEALYRLSEKWDIGIIDLWNDPDMAAVSPEDYALYMHDPIHPTRAGYLKWWTPKFREALRRLPGRGMEERGKPVEDSDSLSIPSRI